MGLAEEYVHGLSRIPSRQRRTSLSHAPQSDRDHLASLDGLALLFVFSPKRDGSDIMGENQPINDTNQIRYTQELLEKVKGTKVLRAAAFTGLHGRED